MHVFQPLHGAVQSNNQFVITEGYCATPFFHNFSWMHPFLDPVLGTLPEMVEW
jgi:hypothetical protein